MQPYLSITVPEAICRPGFAAQPIDRFRGWRERRRWIAEMADATALGRLDGVLHDVGMSRADLDFLIDAPADAGNSSNLPRWRGSICAS